MSRTLRQTTALAAMIAVAAPQIGVAQPIPQDRIEAHRAEMEAARPDQAAQLAQELAGGLTVEALTCTDSGAAPDCALATPSGIAVVLGEDGSILLAPAGAPEAVAAPETMPEPEAAAEAETAAEEPEADTPAEETAAEATAEEAPAEEAAAEAASDPAPAEVPQADAAPQADGAPDADELAKRLAEESEATEEAASTEDGAVEADATADGATEAAATDASETAPVEDAVADEAVTGDATPTEAVSAEGAPAADTAAVAPSAEAASETAAAETPVTDDLAKALADATGDDTPPEARAEEPDEAAALAAEAEAPVAAALDVADDATDEGEAITVTEDAARSSAEDFTTSISAAMKEAQTADDSGSNRDRDLARALLAGLAGYAVGQAVGDNGQVALNSGDRVVIIRQDGSQQVLKDDSALMFQPGSQVQTQNFADGSSRIVVTRDDGSRVITIRDANLRVLRRTLVHPDGTEVKLIDDTAVVEPVRLSDLPPPARPAPAPVLTDEAALRQALEVAANQTRRFTLGQIRDIAGVRALIAPVNIDGITFDTGSAAIRPDQARQLAALGKVIADYTRANPGEVFLVEGYTDTVGSDAMNLALSDRRAESLALALTEYFSVPPENLVVQGYGERFLKVPVEGDIRENRRVAVRRITDLLARN